MAIDRAKFFAGIRSGPFPGTIAETTVQGVTAILDEWERRGLTDLRWLAYMLATVLAECGRNMLPVREGFKQTDEAARAYVASKHYKYAKVEGGQVYYGRGLVQLTWLDNYRKMSTITGIDLVSHPDRALEPPVAAKIMFEGMIRGTFTGKKLADYFNATTSDWTNARRIINALDRAGEIAGYAKQFHADLVAADTGKPLVDAGKVTGGVAAGGGVVAGASAAAEAGWSTMQITMLVVGLLVVAAAAFFAWRWWQRRKAAEVQEISAREFDHDDADAQIAATEPDADAIAAEIANKAKGGLACQVAVTEAMTKPVKTARRKRKATPAKRAVAKKRANKRRAK